jgi:hypothetical protein
MATPAQAPTAGVSGNPALIVHYVELAVVGAFVGSHERFSDLFRRKSLA